MMKTNLLASMQEALALVKSGNLLKATELIQQGLNGKLSKTAANQVDASVIEGELVRKPAKPVQKAKVEQSHKPAQPEQHAGTGKAQFITKNFSNEHGAREYKLYIPSSYGQKPLPLVVMLHGCTQTADDFAAGTAMNQLAEELGFLVAYPNQTASANNKRCWNWFKAQDQQAHQGEPAIIAGLTQAIIHDYQADKQRVYIAGLSAGGAMAAIMGATYPKLYAAVGVHSGLAVGSATNVISALAAMNNGSCRVKEITKNSASFVPTIIFHGDNDSVVHLRNGGQVYAQAEQRLKASNDDYFNDSAFQLEQEQIKSQQGHSYTRSCLNDAQGLAHIEYWTVHGSGHAWSGGNTNGSYVDPQGPNASREMLRFFLSHHH
ncbi:MAG: alpha/beta hydrolase family esterase [Thiolinea sp.]